MITPHIFNKPIFSLKYLIFLVVLSFGAFALLKMVLYFYNRKKTSLRWLLYYIMILVAVFGFGAVATLMQWPTLLWIVSCMTIVIIIFELMMIPVLPAILIWQLLIPRKKTAPQNPGRRIWLKRVAFGLPLGALFTAGWGVKNGLKETLIPMIPLSFKILPEGLDGLKILHLTDLHLSYFTGLEDLKSILERSQKQHPDMIMITGDFVDDYELLPGAVALVEQYIPKYGAYYCFGNHENFRGREPIFQHIQPSQIEMLVDQGKTLTINGATLNIIGVDDPKHQKAGKDPNFYRKGFKKGIDITADFKIGLLHQPKGFPVAADLGIDLTLSGHTHGAQMGYDGESILKGSQKFPYPWGHYTIGQYQLYVSAGGGNWFPFRIGCPREAPIYLLKRICEK